LQFSIRQNTEQPAQLIGGMAPLSQVSGNSI
jgi:hypothetical protein